MSKKPTHVPKDHPARPPDLSRVDRAVRTLEHAQGRLEDAQSKLQPLREDVIAAKEELACARAEAEDARPRNLGDVTVSPKQMR